MFCKLKLLFCYYIHLAETFLRILEHVNWLLREIFASEHQESIKLIFQHPCFYEIFINENLVRVYYDKLLITDPDYDGNSQESPYIMYTVMDWEIQKFVADCKLVLE